MRAEDVGCVVEPIPHVLLCFLEILDLYLLIRCHLHHRLNYGPDLFQHVWVLETEVGDNWDDTMILHMVQRRDVGSLQAAKGRADEEARCVFIGYLAVHRVVLFIESN